MSVIQFGRLKDLIPVSITKGETDFFQESQAAVAVLRPKLNGSDISGKVDALNRILATYSVGGNIDALFPDIARQLFVADGKVKRLAHICLKLLADKHPDVVLLCVNALQRDASDMDPLTRGISLRTTCAIEHKEVAEDSLRALQKGSVDSSVYVRKSAAISVANLFLKQPGRLLVESDEMFVIFERLLGDSEPTVLATTMMALYLVTKGNDSLTEATMSLVHQFYLRITNSLLELDWLGQVFAIELLKTYCLRNFKSGSQSEHYRLFVDNLNTVIRFSSSSCVVQTGLRALKDLDAHSENFDHVIANRMLQSSPEIQGMFLHNVGKKKAIKLFLINCFSDNSATKISKLEILSQSLTKRNAAFLLTETAQYIRSSQHTDSLFIEKCIAFIVKIGTDMAEDSGLHEWCLRILIGMIDSHDATVSNEAVTAVKSLIQATNCAKEEIMKKVCIYLSSIIVTISSPLARASAIWLINLCHDTAPIVVPNVLRVVARELESQESTVKLELCMLAVKVQAFHEDNARTGDNGKSCPQAVSNQLLAALTELVNYVLHVCSRDPSVGGLVRAVGSNKFDIPTIEAKPIQVEAEVVSESKSGTRVTEDTPDSIRAPKLFTKSSMHEGKSTSSDQSSSTCVSSTISVPTTMKHPAPKAAQTLEDLDSFFTAPSTADSAASRQEAEPAKVAIMKSKKATIDLTNADWI